MVRLSDKQRILLHGRLSKQRGTADLAYSWCLVIITDAIEVCARNGIESTEMYLRNKIVTVVALFFSAVVLRT